jgi:hypothetical protein
MKTLPVIDRPAWLSTSAWPWPTYALEHDTGRIAVTDVGHGPPLLFVHVGSWSFVWRDVLARLQNDFRCIALDAPGCGLSERVESKLSARAKSRTIAAAVLLAVMAVAVVVIVGSQSSSRGGSASPTSTNESTRKLDPRLRAMLPSGDGCGVLLKNSDLPDAAMAGASCHPNVSGSLVTSLDYWLFADQGSLDSWVTQPPATGFQPCPGRGPSPQDWHSTWNPQLQGKIVCFVDDGEPYVRWSINSQLLFGQASGVYLDSLYHWWAARYQP